MVQLIIYTVYTLLYYIILHDINKGVDRTGTLILDKLPSCHRINREIEIRILIDV